MEGTPLLPTHPSPAHLQVFNTEFAAEKLVLLPHVLLQICKGVEGLCIGAQGTFVLQQLPEG